MKIILFYIRPERYFIRETKKYIYVASEYEHPERPEPKKNKQQKTNRRTSKLPYQENNLRPCNALGN